MPLRREKIVYIPLDSYTDLVVNFGLEIIEITKQMDEDIAKCVADLRQEHEGRYTTSVEFERGRAKYSEPVDTADYYTLWGQLEDINRAIDICRSKLR